MPAETETTDPIVIAGREFRVGQTYAGRSRTKVQRTFLGLHQWRGWVAYRRPDADGSTPITAGAWARWAGEEVQL